MDGHADHGYYSALQGYAMCRKNDDMPYHWEFLKLKILNYIKYG